MTDILSNKLNLNGDNVGGNAPALRAAIGAVYDVNLTSPDGAGLVGFQQDDAGALHRNLLDKLRDSVAATDYAAGGGIGISDDTAGLTAALAHCGLTGKDLFVPAVDGGFNITDTLTVPAGVRVWGGGAIAQHTANKTVIILSNDTRLEDLTIRGTGLSNNTLHNVGGSPVNVGVLVPSGRRNIRIERCDISGCEGSGIYDGGARNVWYKDNFLHDNTWGLTGPYATSYASAADILFYSNTASSGIVEVTGNRCVSNNSQGIAFAVLGLGRDAVIAHNYIDIWDETGAQIPFAPGVHRRRHGIVTNYLSQATSFRLMVHHNIIRNTIWTGVYTQATDQDNGPMLIENNIIEKVGYETGSSLSAGVFTASRGKAAIVVKGNIILDFLNTNSGSGAFVATSSSLNNSNVRYIDNHVLNSRGRGYLITNWMDQVSIAGGTIVGSAAADIAISLSAGTTAASGVRVEGVDIRRTAAGACIVHSPQSSDARLTVTGCTLRGMGSEVATAENRGILSIRPWNVDIVDNDIADFHVGVDSLAYWTLGTRFFSETRWDRNRISNCMVGFGLGATASSTTMPLCDNVFHNVAAPTNGGMLNGYAIGVLASRCGTAIEVYGLSAKPATGTWAIGDEAVFTGAGKGGIPRARCVTAGNPGCWVAYPELATIPLI